MTEPYENLANAVVLLAVKDWREAMGKLKKRPRHKPALKKKVRNGSRSLLAWKGVSSFGN